MLCMFGHLPALKLQVKLRAATSSLLPFTYVTSGVGMPSCKAKCSHLLTGEEPYSVEDVG